MTTPYRADVEQGDIYTVNTPRLGVSELMKSCYVM